MHVVTFIIALIITTLLGAIIILQSKVSEKEALLAAKAVQIAALERGIAQAKSSIEAQNEAILAIQNEALLAQSKAHESTRVAAFGEITLKGGSCEDERDTLYHLLAVAAVR